MKNFRSKMKRRLKQRQLLQGKKQFRNQIQTYVSMAGTPYERTFRGMAYN